jgi:hypothetical protein
MDVQERIGRLLVEGAMVLIVVAGAALAVAGLGARPGGRVSRLLEHRERVMRAVVVVAVLAIAAATVAMPWLQE